MKKIEDIDKLYNKWLTSCDEKISRKSFVIIYSKLKHLTEKIIWDFDKNLMEYKDDIYHEVLEKTLVAINKDMINNTDFFSSWFRATLKNHLINFAKSEKRNKRRNIISASKLTFDYESAEDKYSYEIFENQETLFDLKDSINQVFTKEPEHNLFLEKHLLEIPIKELSQKYKTTEANIKYRLGKSKKILKIKFKKYIQ